VDTADLKHRALPMVAAWAQTSAVGGSDREVAVGHNDGRGRRQPDGTGGRALPVRRGLTAQRLARAAVRFVPLHVVELQKSALFQQTRTATADARQRRPRPARWSSQCRRDGAAQRLGHLRHVPYTGSERGQRPGRRRPPRAAAHHVCRPARHGAAHGPCGAAHSTQLMACRLHGHDFQRSNPAMAYTLVF
jgi:hypothetical protein